MRIVDTLPPGVTFVSVAARPSSARSCHPNQVVCDLPSLPAQRRDLRGGHGARSTPTSPTARCSPTPSRSSSPTRTVVDPVSSNNFAALTNPVATAADLTVAKRTYSLDLPSFGFTVPSSAPAGTPTGYLIDVRNDGPSVARDVVLVDTSTMTDFFLNQVRLIRPGLDPEVIDITADCSFSGGDLPCPLGDLPVFAAGDPSWTIQVDGVTLSNAVAGRLPEHRHAHLAHRGRRSGRQRVDRADHRHRPRRHADDRQDERSAAPTSTATATSTSCRARRSPTS